MSKKIIFAILTVGIITTATVYALFDPERHILFPKCPFKMMTGLDCPGCGSQRALYHMLHFDIATAFHYNPLLVVATPYLLLGAWLTLPRKRTATEEKIRKSLYGLYAAYIWIAIIAIYWIGRNLL